MLYYYYHYYYYYYYHCHHRVCVKGWCILIPVESNETRETGGNSRELFTCIAGLQIVSWMRWFITRWPISDWWRTSEYGAPASLIDANTNSFSTGRHTRRLTYLIMAALRSRCGHYIFALWFLSSIFYLFFIPRLISAVAYSISTILKHMVWP